MRSGERIANELRKQRVEPQFRAFPAMMYPNAKGGSRCALTVVGGR